MMKLVTTLALTLCAVPFSEAFVAELYTTNDVQNLVYNATLPVIVDIYRDDCNPCQQLMPIFTKASNNASYAGKVEFVKTNVKSSAAHSFNGIRSVPTLLFYYQGVEKGRITGSRSSTALKQQIDTWLASINN